MIVEVDFLDHYKTRLLVRLLGPTAPLLCIRLWGHCQLRQAHQFRIGPMVLAAICHWEGDADKLYRAMLEAGFIEEPEPGLIAVHDWDKVNGKLIANWTNGRKGGRPPKTPPPTPHPQPTPPPTGNPPETHAQPSDAPRDSHAQPIEKIEKIDGIDETEGEEGAYGETSQDQIDRIHALTAALQSGGPRVKRRLGEHQASLALANAKFKPLDLIAEAQKFSAWAEAHDQQPRNLGGSWINWLNRAADAHAEAILQKKSGAAPSQSLHVAPRRGLYKPPPPGQPENQASHHAADVFKAVGMPT